MISAGPLVGHTAIEGDLRYSIKYQIVISSIKYKYDVSGIRCLVSSIR